MENIGDMRFYTFEEFLDEHLGQKGTERRDAHERQVADALYSYRIGEAIKEARIKQNLTQQQLGERIGVKKAQISRIERGYSITIPTMGRVFRALGISSASLDLGVMGKVALW